MNCDFAKKQKFSEQKLACFMEVMHYVMLQLVKQSLSEDDAFKMFKTLLLRHAVQRPPHSLAIFNLEDVKAIDLFAQDTFFRHYDMYKYALTYQVELSLKTGTMFTYQTPSLGNLAETKQIAPHEVSAIAAYMS